MTEVAGKNVPKGVAVYGRKIGDLRRARFFSQEKLARAAGMSRENLRRIEGEDVTGVHAENFLALAEAFGMKPEELIEAVGANRAASGAKPDVASVMRLAQQLAPAERDEVVTRLGGKPMKQAAKRMRDDK